MQLLSIVTPSQSLGFKVFIKKGEDKLIFPPKWAEGGGGGQSFGDTCTLISPP